MAHVVAGEVWGRMVAALDSDQVVWVWALASVIVLYGLWQDIQGRTTLPNHTFLNLIYIKAYMY